MGSLRRLDPSLLAKASLVVAVYYILARFALSPPYIDGDLGKIVWPASGFALAALLLWGVRLWPAVALGAFVATELTTGPLAHSFATAIGNGMEVLVVVAVLHRLRFDTKLTRARDVMALVAASALGAALSATCGTVGLYLGGLESPSTLSRIFWQWQLGHAMGMLVLTPFLLTLGSWRATSRSVRLETAALMVVLVVVGEVAFWEGPGFLREYSLEYLPFPVLVWAAFRIGVRGAAAANVVTAGMAVWATAAGMGPFASGTSSEDMLLTWSFVNASAITTLLLAVVVGLEKRARLERIQSEDRYRKLVEQAADGIFIADGEGVCTEVNPSGCALLRSERCDVVGARIDSFVTSKERERVAREIRALPPGRAVVRTWTVTRSDGSSFPAEVSLKRFDDGRLQAFVRDETSRHALEAQLHESQKMEAVGILAGGVAHDFNNLLTAILGHADFVRARLPSHLHKEADGIAHAARRAADLTRKLLAFARRQIVEPRVIVLDDLVVHMETMLRRVLGEHVSLEVATTSDEPWRVKIDPLSMEQVLLNLALNAKDAMPQGGRLTIVTRNVHLIGGSDRAVPGLAPGEYVVLEVSDNGTGMDASTLGRVFEPFYTTKDRTQGTGLGLAVSYGIVKQASGSICAESLPGRGSTFYIHLPRSQEPLDLDQPEPGLLDEASAGHRFGERILLVEDETLVRDLAKEVLCEQGYDVLTAASGEEALQVAESCTSPIHLAVTDVVLPAMSGKDFSRVLAESRPETQVLFVSGYAEEEVVHQGVVDERVAFLPKPFTPEELATKVRSVLDDATVKKSPEGPGGESAKSSARNRDRTWEARSSESAPTGAR